MTTFLSSAGADMFVSGQFGAHSYTTTLATAASVSSADTASTSGGEGSPVRRPSSPPQPVPQPRKQPFGVLQPRWEHALEISASPAGSDAAEQFLDAHSELPSACSSFGAEADGAAAMEERLSRASWSRLSSSSDAPSVAAALAAAAECLVADATHGGSGGDGTTSQQLQAERQRRRGAEAAALELRQQLDDISTLLLNFRQQLQPAKEPCAAVRDGASLAGLLAEVLSDAERAAATARQAARDAAAGAEAAATDAACVARMVAGMLARAAAAADLADQWAADKAALERRLEQAARMGQAMLRHQKERGAEPEPWRQQLLSAAFCVGCSVLGAATAILIIRRSQAA